MQAIETKYLGPSNVKGARIVARCDAKRIVLSWDHSLNQEQNHRAAARTLINQLGWFGDWASGAIPNLERSYVHVCVKPVDGFYQQWSVWPRMNEDAA